MSDLKGKGERVSIYFPADNYATLQRIPASNRSALINRLLEEWAQSAKGQQILALWDTQAEQMAAIEASE